MQKYFIVDVEADGPCPNPFSMVCFGAVELSLDSYKTGRWNTFYGQTRPISDAYNADALKVSGFTREQHKQFDYPQLVMQQFLDWIESSLPIGAKPVFVSDNLAFDWQWINWYFWYYVGGNIFGHSGRRIGDLYCGMKKDLSKNHEWKKMLRKTRHTHDPVQDSIGNAEALCAILSDNSFRLGGLIL